MDSLRALPLPCSPHDCSYLPGLRAEFEHYLFWRPGDEGFCLALEAGFRHFGEYFFRPACPGARGQGWCGACLPLRVPVADFRPSHSQRRVLRKGAGVVWRIGRPAYSEQKYELYLRHRERFPEQGSEKSEDGSRAAFRESFYQPSPFAWECTYTLGEELVGVGYLDVASRLVSSIYFYFDPRFAELSPGTLSVLRELELARRLGITHYYLGYTLERNPALRYKMAFRPCEIFDGHQWRLLRNAQGAFMLDPAALRTTPYERLLNPEK